MMNTLDEITKYAAMLPEDDKEMILTIIKKFIVAWDPDYTKLTDDEKKTLEEAESSEGEIYETVEDLIKSLK